MSDLSDAHQKIAELRQEIDLINQSILSALNLRQMNVIKILQLKRQLDIKARDPQRETQMLQKVITMNSGPISNQTVQDVFQAIFHHTLDDAKQF